jgi:hypothetical protein
MAADKGETKIPAHARGDLSVAGYLLRILTALCRQSGGELRISGAEVDRVGEATSLVKEWDAEHQQLVLRIESVSFREVFTLTPERQTPPAPTVRPVHTASRMPGLPRQPTVESPLDGEFLPKRSLLNEDPALIKMQKDRDLVRAAATLRAHLRESERKRKAEAEGLDEQ